jgi:hypothetical protein
MRNLLVLTTPAILFQHAHESASGAAENLRSSLILSFRKARTLLTS